MTKKTSENSGTPNEEGQDACRAGDAGATPEDADDSVRTDSPGPAQAEDEEQDVFGAADVEELDFSLPEESEEPEPEPSEIEEEESFVEDMPEAEAFRTPDELKSAIECLLFTTPHPLSLARLRTILGNVDMRTLRGAATRLQTEYDARAGGLQIVESAEGYLMCTRPQFAGAVLRLHRHRKRNPLTATALETLAIVAYKQPITRAEIEMIRGVESSGVLRNLCDMGMVKVVGRKEVIGRPQLYGTTSVFLRTFGLRSVDELPTIQALRQRYGLKPALAASEQERFDAESAEVLAEDRPDANDPRDDGDGADNAANPADIGPEETSPAP